jgi:hypothetical protein
MTLTFLILAGQVKVKGQLGEMAKCVEDGDERIREMSRMFFAELAGKDNAVYNHFVDMFSLLSADEDLDEERFRKVIKFLASFIEKVSAMSWYTKENDADHTLNRISMPNNWLESWRPDCNALRRRGNGTMLPLPSTCCRTRTMISRSWSMKVVRLLRLERNQATNVDITIRRLGLALDKALESDFQASTFRISSKHFTLPILSVVQSDRCS